jgi:glycosyltransferase involved in cell wall biosynthesis
MNQETIFSIIIPHKNIPDLLLRCLNSIPRREDVQIIVVDDNSDENKVDFNNFPGLGDKYVEVYLTKEGNGAGYARNIGLNYAKGKWVLFADADDYFTPSFLFLVDKYKSSPHDIIYFGINGINTETKKVNFRGKKYNKLMINAILYNKVDDYKYKAYVPWGKMIRHSLIEENKISFDETLVANDVMFSIKTAYFSKTAFFDSNKIYTLESRDNSLMSIKSLDAELHRLCVFINLNIFLKNISKKEYRVNLIPFLYRLIKTNAFFEGIAMIKKKKINLALEIFNFTLSLPKRLARKLKIASYKLFKL